MKHPKAIDHVTVHPAERHPLTSHHWHWAMPAMAAVFGVLVGSGILLSFQAKWQSEAGRHRIAEPAKVSPALKEVESSLYQMSVTGPVLTVAQDKAFTPAAGQNLVIISLSVTNSGAVVRPFLPSVHTYMRDDEGGTYPMHPSTGVTKPLPATDLAPGQTVAGQLSYAIPERLKNFRLYIDPVWSGMTPVVFALSR